MVLYWFCFREFPGWFYSGFRNSAGDAFAIIMMNIFGVSGNLMSLGALDFGLIVDGAVIIVEAVLHRLHSIKGKEGERISGEQMNKEVKTSAGKMMNSAVFGQVIILIVYLPILSLQGIEGKCLSQWRKL